MSMQSKNKNQKQTKNSTWYSEGIRFECQGSGQCCTSHGEYGFVYFTYKDRTKAAKLLNITVDEFTKKYCSKTDGIFHLIERSDNPDCIFLKDKRCSIYSARPTQCRTWPFWPEHMSAKRWAKDIASFCPGVGKGQIVPLLEIENIIKEQEQSNRELGT